MRLRLYHALLLVPLLSAPLLSTAGLAQNITSPAADHHGRRSAAEHFADANTTHDGRLTMDQATAGYKSIAKTFTQIDLNHRGYITLDDIKAWKAAKKAAKLAAKHAEDDAAAGIVRPIPAVHRGYGPTAVDTSTDLVAPGAVEKPRTGVDMPMAPLGSGRSS